jgi:hypothetical protein
MGGSLPGRHHHYPLTGDDTIVRLMVVTRPEVDAMHPWITGRIVETMQHEARERAARTRSRPAALVPEPRRERVGLAVARLGYRIAGCVPRGVDGLAQPS